MTLSDTRMPTAPRCVWCGRFLGAERALVPETVISPETGLIGYEHRGACPQ
jgi:hypothetical protein